MEPATAPDIAARMERARALSAEWETKPGVLGTYLYGSSVRPYADANSDFDVRVIFEDEPFKAIPIAEIHTNVSEAGKKLGDVWAIRRSELENPTRDVDRHSAKYARMLFDPQGTVASILQRVAQIPSSTREVRLRVHYYELTFLAQKVQNAHRRSKRTPAMLISGQLVLAVAKLLLIERGEWPTPMSWMFEELELAGVPTELISQLHTVLETADVRAIRTLRGAIDPYLLDRGHTFIDAPVELWEWLFHTPEGERAQRDWAGPV
jgi:predicted nucleotidyltransferase